MKGEIVRIAIASGKGGTGKTTISCALAEAAEHPVCLLDCDVEEPNSHFFIHPEVDHRKTVHSLIPKINAELCDGCGECRRVCQFNALVVVKNCAMVFPELCHSCGACARICPTGAIAEIEQPIGHVETGVGENNTQFVSGQMDVGQAMAPPVIRATLQHAATERLTLIDCPPGTSCPFVTAVKGSDVVLLVTEPTPFGLHDLSLAVDTLRQLGLPFAVAVNRVNADRDIITDYCEQEDVPLILRIPESRRIAEAYSRGETLLSASPAWRESFAGLPAKLAEIAGMEVSCGC